MMRLFGSASIVLIVVSILSFCPFTFMMNWSEGILWTVRILLLIITIVLLIRIFDLLFFFICLKSQPDKRLVVKEALRTVKKGGVFAFHDLFLLENVYGDMKEFVEELKAEGISEITFVESRNENFIPGILKVPSMLGKIGLIYGRK